MDLPRTVTSSLAEALHLVQSAATGAKEMAGWAVDILNPTDEVRDWLQEELKPWRWIPDGGTLVSFSPETADMQHLPAACKVPEVPEVAKVDAGVNAEADSSAEIRSSAGVNAEADNIA